MARPNHVVGALLQEFADLITVSGGQAFKARAYEKAARAVLGSELDVSTLGVAELEQIPNVGKSTAEKIFEYFTSGRIEALEKMRAKVPTGTRQLMRVPGVGSTKAMVLAGELGIRSVDELATAIQEGRLAGLRGFGPKAVENIQRGIEQLLEGGGRVLIPIALDLADTFVATLSAVEGVVRCEAAGSLRRFRESIRDVDIVAAAVKPEAVIEAFVTMPLVTAVVSQAPREATILAVNGLHVDLHVVEEASWGTALQHATGSPAHNDALAALARSQGVSLPARAATEAEVYAAVGLPWIPPVLREDRGELSGAGLPDLVQVKDLRGDLHTHTDLTDGIAPVERMVEAARKRGYEYYAVTDHAPNLVMQRMTDEKMLMQRRFLRALDAGDMVLLHGSELNIDPDGEVDWGPEFLAAFDVLVASVHSQFRQPKAEMTRRLIRAIENPYVNIIGHLTTRKVGRRPPIEADFDAVFEAAAATGTAIEINSHPDRLDLPDDLVFKALKHGVKFAIDSDSHSTTHLGHVRFGVAIAQRGWVTADDVVNTWPLARLREFVAAKRPSG
ncbi:MAG TPA: helix-hairpin-helix domain-containing protein [Candidatus Limnocylindrales bacterium]|nr:helix-hairpin-helix domain-containing protein [Candidatus Limnocylindrales bacterium]